MKIKAHFDGKVIVPDEPVDLPVGQPVEVELNPIQNGIDDYEKLSIEERRRRLEKFSGRIRGVTIPDEALRRENLYDDRI